MRRRSEGSRVRIKVLGPVEVEQDGALVQTWADRSSVVCSVCSWCIEATRCRRSAWSMRCGPTKRARLTVPPGRCARTCHASRSPALTGRIDHLSGRDRLRARRERRLASTSRSSTPFSGRPRGSAPDRSRRASTAKRSRCGGDDPFGEYADEWWALSESSRLQERRASSAERGPGRGPEMTMGHHDRAVPGPRRLTAERPLR